MVSRILLKLIDEAIVPAVVLIGVKLGSVIILSLFFDISWDLQSLSIVSVSAADFIALNSYSNLMVLLSICLGLAWVILKSYILHDTHITPTLAAKLVSLNLIGFVGTTVQIYHQAVIWWLYAALLAFLISLQAYYGLVYGWIAFISVLVTVSSTWLLILDVEREVALIREEKGFEETSFDLE